MKDSQIIRDIEELKKLLENI